MSVSLPDQDRRVTALRPDLASRALEGVLPATVYVDPALKVARAAAAGIHAAPDAGYEQQDQLLFGEGFEVLDEAGGWAWGQARRDGYVGYVRAEALAPAGAPATHRVAAIRTYAFVEPSIKSRALGPYSLNALVAMEATAAGSRRPRAPAGSSPSIWPPSASSRPIRPRWPSAIWARPICGVGARVSAWTARA
jgi:hypothetical protein